MKILLIDPPYQRFMNFYRYFYPIGLAYLAAALKTHNHQVSIYDAEHDPQLHPQVFQKVASAYNNYLNALQQNNKIWTELTTVLAQVKPDIVGISAIAPCKIGSTLKTAEICKKYNPNIKTIIGGQLSQTSIQTVISNPNIDYVVQGEGETTLTELMNCLENNQDPTTIQGLTHKKDGTPKSNQKRPQIKDINTIKFPAIDSLLNLETYRPIDLGILLASRGCTYGCTFCGLKDFWGRTLRQRSTKNVIEEIRSLKERYAVPYFSFWDASFTLNKKWVLQLCKELADLDSNLEWECMTRIDSFDNELIAAMKKAGCRRIRIGIESGSDDVLNYLNKGYSVNQIKKQAKILNENNLNWSAYLMLGTPQEKETDILQTMELIKEIKPNFVTIGTFYPIPDTEIYNNLKKTGNLQNSDYNLLSTKNLSVTYTNHIPQKRFQQLIKQFIDFTEEINTKNYSNDPLFQGKPSQ
jgi:anaerobic magnesium-protoporphyrin IX monomethyl ester cyclase